MMNYFENDTQTFPWFASLYIPYLHKPLNHLMASYTYKGTIQPHNILKGP